MQGIDINGGRRRTLGGFFFLNNMLKCDYLSESPTPSRGIMSLTGSGLAKSAFSAGSTGEGLVELSGFLNAKNPLILLKKFGFDRGIDV
jgi:hypothetical protein